MDSTSLSPDLNKLGPSRRIDNDHLDGLAVLIITTYCRAIICWLTSLLKKYFKNELIN
jgi:hypothetical protein